MKKNKKHNVIWLDEPEEHDFPAAVDYLELLFPKGKVNTLVNSLRIQKTIKKKAKDILRAASLPLLSKKNIHVKNNINKVKNGEHLSPVLLVIGNEKLHIADGYHRVCAIYYLSEDLEIPCRLV
jgi:disulfide oxidoreductase YuzD